MAIKFSVIIPTYNRVAELRKCLVSITHQNIPFTDFEIIIINDGGSTDIEQVVAEFKSHSGENLIYLWQQPAGPATARNRALNIARGEIIFFLNDDVILEKGYFSAHLQAHLRQPGHAVRGNTRWHPEVLTTPFMQWVAQSVLFYYLIEDPLNIGYEYFHTLDLSIHRRWLEEDKFDEAFKDASFEDTELALRLIKKGLKLQFAPLAVCYHYHFYDLPRYLEKTRINARNALLLVARHPELHERLIGNFLRQHSLKNFINMLFYEITGNKQTPAYWNLLSNKVYTTELLKQKALL
ncbi:MAG: glycosyltransferase [Candidatus Sumerlaeia bacterium]|nr:glycosyltransferase [Candidatus Sumerlaeia bacterium]